MVAEIGSTNIELATQTLEEAFPNTDCGIEPLGARVIIQIKSVKSKTASGIVLVEETKDTEKWNIQTAKVVKLGPLAFKNRDTGNYWTEGQWVFEGDFVRVPRWGGDRFGVKVEGAEDEALFVILNDHELIAKIVGDPLKQKAFLL